MEGIKHGSIADGFYEGFGATVDLVLSFFSNSLSYVRLAAFAVAHVAFGLVAEIMVGEQLTLSGLPMLLMLNFLVLSIEAIVVFIQSLRLLFYEFYGKFYKTGQLVYSPFTL